MLEFIYYALWVIVLPAIGALIYWGIKIAVEKTVQHKLDKELENWRAELRRSEEALKSDLRLKESEIATLRDGVFGGRAKRQEIIDKRRIEAIECVWGAIQDLAPYKMIAAQMALFNIPILDKRISSEPKLISYFDTMIKTSKSSAEYSDPAKVEQLFVSPMAWAYYSAYKIVVFSSYGQARLLSLGIENSSELINKGNVKKLLKVALPHYEAYIDQYETNVMYNLLEVIEEKTLDELQRNLKGEELEQAEIQRASEIMKIVRDVAKDDAQHKGQTPLTEVMQTAG